jgi:hypothetical protein
MGPTQPPAQVEESPEIEVTMKVTLRGALANMEVVGLLVADMDEWMHDRYPEQYTGVNVKLDVMPDAGAMP